MIGFGQCVSGDCENGQGTYFYTTGDQYIGEFKNGEHQGSGTMTWSDGARYVGEWKENKRDGKGTMLLPNGAKYEGEWKESKRDGQGKYVFNEYKYEGLWENDTFIENKSPTINKTTSKNHNTIKDEYYLADDYKLLAFQNGDALTQNLKSIIVKLSKYGFILKKSNDNIFSYYKGISPYITFYNEKKTQWKIIHCLVDDANDLAIWKVENSIYKGNPLKNFRKDVNVEALFKQGISDKEYSLIATNTLYDYQVTINSRSSFWPQPTYVDVKVYSVDWGDCPMYEEDGSLAKDCQFALVMGNEVGENNLSLGKTKKECFINYSFEYLSLSEFSVEQERYIEGVRRKKIVIPIKKEGNMNFISIKIGGKSYKYLFDTGASDMVINTEMKDYLMQAGVLKSSDFGRDRIYEIANGQKVSFKTATLNSIEISGNKFTDIPIAIGDDASLLLGMSFLDRFNWRINKDVLELERK